MDNENIYIDIETSDGMKKYLMITAFEVEYDSFIVLLDEELREINIFGYNELSDNEIEIYQIIDDEKWNKALEKFNKLMEEE